MARSRSLVRVKLGIAVAALSCLLFPQGSEAQSLPRLVVERFSMSARPVSPTIGRAFALTILLRVRGNVRRIDNVTLPILSQLALRGDERSISHTLGASIYRETLTVRAERTGKIELAPATLDAIDARTGQAEQYSSNALTIVVRGGSVQPFATVGSAVGRLVPIVEHLAMIAALLFAAASLTAIALLYRRRPQRPEPLPTPPILVAEPVVEQTRNERLRDAALVLRAEPTRAVVGSVRVAVRSLVGATAKETLSDVLARLPDADRDLAPLLRALERAAFTTDDDLPSAIRTCEDAFAEVLP
ncbi:MAG: hypothetical protein HKL92_07780 [Candidatus Eremiobacteraeota bacterium]|nr:hypothetical protein [Candidatus Eremiobacteraeota bacterium]NNM93226.1 hypothetical protein [Candidatus Eremiobacteraeota bacterium]